MKIVSGTNRTVFLIGNYAIKIPKVTGGYENFIDGIRANLIERTFGTCGFSELAKIYYANRFGIIQIMERTQPCSSRLYRQNLIELVNKTRLAPSFILYDEKPANFGITRNGKFVKIDYSC